MKILKYIKSIMEKVGMSSSDLMQKLVNAKKVMNKVDSGNYETGNINENILRSAPEDLDPQSFDASASSRRPVNNNASVERINQTKLPDAIKKAMIENPIAQMPQISLSEGLDMDFVKGAKRLMEQEGVSTKSQPQQRSNQSNSNVDMNSLAILIENTVRKVMDEKLNQILTAQTTSSINENLVLKVGDSIFKGKITGVNKAK
jgi:hypothetical protein